MHTAELNFSQLFQQVPEHIFRKIVRHHARVDLAQQVQERIPLVNLQCPYFTETGNTESSTSDTHAKHQRHRPGCAPNMVFVVQETEENFVNFSR